MPVKVAHITLSMGTGGIEKLVLDLCRHADTKKFDLSVICLDEGGALLDEAAAAGAVPFVVKREPGLDWRLMFRLSRLFRERGFQVIHAHNQAAAFYAGIAAFVARVPVSIVTEHSRHNIEASVVRRVEKKVLSVLTHKWVNVSRQLAQETVGPDRVGKGKVTVIVNGVDCHRIKNPRPAVVQELRERYGVREGARHVVMVARLERIKNHQLMLDALSLLAAELADVRLILVGDGELRGALRERATAAGLGDRVLFLGVRKEVPEILSLSDVFVLCSLSEGLPLSLLEAAAGGVPVVITEHSNGANFIRHGENGIVVKDDASALAAGIRASLVGGAETRRMAARACREVEEEFSLHSTVRRYEELYLELVAGAGGSGA